MPSTPSQQAGERKKLRVFHRVVRNDDGHNIVRAFVMIQGKPVMLHLEYTDDDLYIE